MFPMRGQCHARALLPVQGSVTSGNDARFLFADTGLPIIASCAIGMWRLGHCTASLSGSFEGNHQIHPPPNVAFRDSMWSASLALLMVFSLNPSASANSKISFVSLLPDFNKFVSHSFARSTVLRTALSGAANRSAAVMDDSPVQ